jgi:hypothetical protein
MNSTDKSFSKFFGISESTLFLADITGFKCNLYPTFSKNENDLARGRRTLLNEKNLFNL